MMPDQKEFQGAWVVSPEAHEALDVPLPWTSHRRALMWRLCILTTVLF